MRTDALEPGPAPKVGPFPYVMNTAQVAAFLGVSPQTVRDLMRRRHLPRLHLGPQTLRFLLPRVEEWLLRVRESSPESAAEPVQRARRPSRRSRVRASVRFRVLRRDGFACTYCGRTAADGVTLTVDHRVPVALGGGHEEANLTTACCECNSGKGVMLAEGEP